MRFEVSNCSAPKNQNPVNPSSAEMRTMLAYWELVARSISDQEEYVEYVGLVGSSRAVAAAAVEQQDTHSELTAQRSINNHRALPGH
jgi:hypothetical protein